MDRKVTVVRNTSFCFGVERAVDQVYEQIEVPKNKKTSGPIYIYGPIIHNKEIVKDLSDKGVMALKIEDELRTLLKNQGTVTIRSHGINRHAHEIPKERSVAVADATCPFVRKVHHITAEHSAAGEAMVTIGSPDHSEVKGIKGWGNEHATVIKDKEGVDNYHLPEDRKSCIISRTTFNYNKSKELVEKFLRKGCGSSVLNTICSAAQERQVETARTALQVDAMIAIGGRHSFNTQKFYEICLKECKDAFYIQALGDLDPDSASSMCSADITAGAPTPRKIIEEAHTRMTEQGFAELLKEKEEPTKPICIGEVVTGQVTETSKDEIILSITGNKFEGVITRDEYSNDSNVDLTTKVQIGGEMEAKVIKLNSGVDMVSLSYKRMAANRSDKRLEGAFENQEVLTAKIAQVLGGGLSAKAEGAEVFTPASLVSDSYEKDLSKHAGQDIGFVITELDPKRGRIVGGRRQFLVTQETKLKEELFARIQSGDTVGETVKSVTDPGAFIDLSGVDGLLHISGASRGCVENPKKVFRTRDQVKVLIKDIQGRKIALSLKFPEANPWVNATDRYVVGNMAYGHVVRIIGFGVFIELEPGVDALLHVSQISRKYAEKSADVLRVGQEIEAKVADFNETDHKISLSTEAMLAPVAQDVDATDMDIDATSQYTEEQGLDS